MKQFCDIKAEKKRLLTFEPDTLLIQFAQTKERIIDIEKQIGKNKVLLPLKSPLEELLGSINSIERVTKVYSDVYLQIIKPIQIESKKGMKTTVTWAIISILLATIFSVMVTNWTYFKGLVPSKHSQTSVQP